MAEPLSDTMRYWLAEGRPAVVVRVVAARGSTPREAGAAMLVGNRYLAGTIGGGRLEWEAVAHARRLLAGEEVPALLDLALGPALHQCCGGVVSLAFAPLDEGALAREETADRRARAADPAVYVFGAGHVGKALAATLAPLPLRVVWVDERAEEFPDRLPAGVTRRCVADPLAELAAAPPGSAVLVLTHSHERDFALAAAALMRGDLAYVGMIGSETKRTKFLRHFRAEGGGAAAAGRLVCPIGGATVRDKRPAVIAALATAEVLTALSACHVVVGTPERACVACPPGRRCTDAGPVDHPTSNP